LALLEMGESMKQMADVKYSLDDNIKQNFLEPLHHMQTKDLKEVMVNSHSKFCSIKHHISVTVIQRVQMRRKHINTLNTAAVFCLLCITF
jgi:hypothetical protein